MDRKDAVTEYGLSALFSYLGVIKLFNDQIKLKEELKNSLIKKFGEPLYHDVLLLIEKISGIDTYIDENLLLKLQNFNECFFSIWFLYFFILVS